jgi:DNA-binding CsgD family transcriptional regulator
VTALSEREKQVLRLLLYGHDAKSIARELDLSVHTVNEHLREARRKAGVSSSREAARVLAGAEKGSPNCSGDKDFGVGRAPTSMSKIRSPDQRGRAGHRVAWLGGGMLIMSLIIAAVALSFAFHASNAPQSGAVPKVIATNPKPGETINPGRIFVSVTYDQPMMSGSASFAGDPKLWPKACGNPRQSKDGRTYRMCFVASPGQDYEIWFNRGQYMNFKSIEGVSAQPYRLVFSTRAN